MNLKLFYHFESIRSDLGIGSDMVKFIQILMMIFFIFHQNYGMSLDWTQFKNCLEKNSSEDWKEFRKCILLEFSDSPIGNNTTIVFRTSLSPFIYPRTDNSWLSEKKESLFAEANNYHFKKYWNKYLRKL